VIGLFVSCPEPANNNPEKPIEPQKTTTIVFDNTRGICTVAVYDNYQRREGDKIAEIPAGRLSEEIEYAPGVSVPFYFLFRVSLKGVNGFTMNYVPKEIGKDQTAVPIEANKKTTITIPKLDETVLSSDEFLSDRSYLLIQNNSGYSFRLERATSIITPDNSSTPLVTSGERAQYTITPGDVSPYQLLVGADYKAFSGTKFEAGRLYSFVFDGTVSLIEEIEIKLGNAAGIIQSSPGLYRGEVKIGTQDLAASLAWISTNAVNGDDFYIVLGEDESSAPIIPNLNGRTAGITLLGYGGERKITLNTNGSLFTVNSGVTLTIGENITLVGRSANTGALVYLNNGKLILNAGAKITGNTTTVTGDSRGGGVFVTGTNASFTLNGGEITGNTAFTNSTASTGSSYGRGGGVYVDSGTFTMTGGEIAGNNASAVNYGIGGGGGVFVNTVGSFTMNSGIISGNTASASRTNIGGGVYVFGNFTMNGGVITGNTVGNSTSAPGWGGGVEVLGTFNMHGGVISGNTASRINDSGGGGGVDIDENGIFNMDGGEITGNTSTFGGGVLVEVGVFTMTGGEISDNTGLAYGGGVCVDNGTFAMDGGNITGNTSFAGGGVYVEDGLVNIGTFTMDSGIINNNTAIYGGGIYIKGIFTMNGGEITANTGSTSGGGVYVDEGTFEFNDGEISGNTSSTYGGGVVVDDGTFVMQDGEISGNTASTYGGGVYVIGDDARFIKLGGVITGYASDEANGNKVKNSLGAILSNRGHAVYVDSSPDMRREVTSGPEDIFDSGDDEEE
jgi:hypothetical protein